MLGPLPGGWGEAGKVDQRAWPSSTSFSFDPRIGPNSYQVRKVKEESEKVGLKVNIQKTKIMASGPITSWQIDGEAVETVTGFIFLAPKPLQMVIAAMKLKDAYSFEGK